MRPAGSVVPSVSTRGVPWHLFTVQANRAYLIKLTNSTPINWSVMGRPSLPRDAVGSGFL